MSVQKEVRNARLRVGATTAAILTLVGLAAEVYSEIKDSIGTYAQLTDAPSIRYTVQERDTARDFFRAEGLHGFGEWSAYKAFVDRQHIYPGERIDLPDWNKDNYAGSTQGLEDLTQ